MNVEKENTPVLVSKNADVGCYNTKTLWAVYLEADAFWKIGEVQLDDCVMILCDGDQNMTRRTGKEYFNAVREHNVKVIYRDILDKTERKYLKAIIKPFRDKVTGIIKVSTSCGEKSYISIRLGNAMFDDRVNLPYFNSNSMYLKMETGRMYHLDELGL